METKKTYIDPYGISYSADRKVLLDFPHTLNIQEYEIISTCEIIGDDAFKVDVDPGGSIDELRYIGNQLKKLFFPKNLMRIGRNALAGCRNLESLYIPESVKDISDNALAGCTNILSIRVDERNLYYDSRDECNGVIHTASNTLIYGCRNTKIPESVLHIGNAAFADCVGLTEIFLPNSLLSKGYASFSGCISLNYIVLPQNVIEIGNNAFFHCASLNSVSLNSQITNLTVNSFEYCYQLKTIYVSDDVFEHYEKIFDGSSSIRLLKSVCISSNLTFTVEHNIEDEQLLNEMLQGLSKDLRLSFKSNYKLKTVWFKLELLGRGLISMCECQQIANQILSLFKNNVLVEIIENDATLAQKVNGCYYKGLPISQCGLIVANGTNFEQIKLLLEKRGFTNVTFILSNEEWTKISFDAKDIWTKEFKKVYNIPDVIGCVVYGNRNESRFKDKVLRKERVVVIYKEDYPGFSDDDKSRDPRLW